MLPWRKDDFEGLEAAVERAEGTMGPHQRGVVGVVRVLDVALFFTRVPIALLCGTVLALLPIDRLHLEVGWLIVLAPAGMALGWFLPELPRRVIVGLSYRAILAAVAVEEAPGAVGGATSAALPSPLSSVPSVPTGTTPDPVAGSDEAG